MHFGNHLKILSEPKPGVGAGYIHIHVLIQLGGGRGRFNGRYAHFGKLLQQLRQDELISLRSKLMKINDLRELQQIAGFDAAYLAPRTAAADQWAGRGKAA